MQLHRNKDTITLLGLPDKMQNDTNTSIEWDVLLVNFICCLSEIQIELCTLYFYLLNLAALLISQVCRTPVSQNLVVPMVLGRDSRGDVCSDGKGQMMSKGPPRRPSS